MAPADPRERIVVDPAEVGVAGMYHLMNAAIAPRPVAWVSTVSADGVANLAPHSYNTVFATDPPTVGFVSVGQKDTVRNAEATGEYVLNIASADLVEALNLTAADFPPEIDELNWAGLTAVPSDLVKPPRVGEAPVSFEARVPAGGIIPIGNSFLILGEVLRAHVAVDVWRDGRIDPQLLQPLGRLAGSMFSRMGETFNLRRTTYADLKEGGPATV